MGPQTSMSQIEHLLQTAEAIRRDGKPEWMQVTGLIHDLGKLLFLFDSEGQWDVVGVRAQPESADSGAWYTDTEPFPQPRTHLSLAANFPTKSYTQRRSRQTQTPTIASIQQNTVSISPTVALIMSCSPGDTTRLVS